MAGFSSERVSCCSVSGAGAGRGAGGADGVQEQVKQTAAMAHDLRMTFTMVLPLMIQAFSIRGQQAGKNLGERKALPVDVVRM